MYVAHPHCFNKRMNDTVSKYISLPIPLIDHFRNINKFDAFCFGKFLKTNCSFTCNK